MKEFFNQIFNQIDEDKIFTKTEFVEFLLMIINKLTSAYRINEKIIALGELFYILSKSILLLK